MFSEISTIDLIVILLYLVGVVGAGCYAGLRKRKGNEASGYFLAGNTLRWPTIGLALFATNISCVHLVALAQAGYDNGLLMGNFEWMAGFTLILLGLVFAPFYIRSRVATLPDFLEQRYCRACRDWLALVSMVAAIIFHIAFPLSAGWLVLHGIFGIEKWTCIVTMCALTALYTVVGGLAAVAITESIQTIVLLLGAVLITAFAYAKVGGWEPMVQGLRHADETIKLSMLRSPRVEPSMPWYAIFLGYPVLGIWYWCADQTIVQRVLGAKDENHARTGPLFCALLKILPVFIFVLPGLMFFVSVNQGKVAHLLQLRTRQEKFARGADGAEAKQETLELDGAASGAALAKTFTLGEGATLDLRSQLTASGASPMLITNVDPARLLLPKDVRVRSTKEAYGIMIKSLLPTGLFGIMAAALMAALMGNLASAANSISTLFSYDLYKRVWPDTPDHKLVFIGRMAALGSFVLGILLVPLLDLYESVFAGINEMIAHVAPPITAVFLLGLFWPRASATGAKWTMWLGSALGALVYSLKTLHTWKPQAFGFLPPFFFDTPFMMMAFYLFVACVVIQVSVTLMAPKKISEDPQKLYWENPLEPLAGPGWPGLANYKVLGALVFVIMTALYVVFH